MVLLFNESKQRCNLRCRRVAIATALLLTMGFNLSNNGLPLDGVVAFDVSLLSSHTLAGRKVGRRSSVYPLTTTTASAAASVVVDINKEDNVIVREKPMLESGADTFDWYKNWYPMMPVECMDPNIPHHMKLFNMDIVVWKDAAYEGDDGRLGAKVKNKEKKERVGGTWRAFVDECPHRKVPLSQGRIENDGTLLCSYHGFRFDGCGEMIAVPQVESNQDDEISNELLTLQRNPKSRCNSFPVQIVDDILWIWPETGDDARLEAALKPVSNYPMSEEMKEEMRNGNLFVGPYNFRELPYSHDYFIENVVDPAHVSISHHNIVGNRYEDQAMKMTTSQAVTKDGFAIDVLNKINTANGGKGERSTTTYRAPCHVGIEGIVEGSTPEEGDALQVLQLYSAPTRPGFCMHVGRMVIRKNKNGKMPTAFKAFTLPMPKWMNHVLAASFLNQDGVLLHEQERYMARAGLYTSSLPTATTNDAGEDLRQQPLDYIKATFPLRVDRGVVNFRTWMRRLAGGAIPYKNLDEKGLASALRVDHDVCFDQWHSHTKHCRYCLGALANIKKARLAAFLLFGILATIRPIHNKVLNAAGSVCAAGIGFGLNKFVGLFYKQEFYHVNND